MDSIGIDPSAASMTKRTISGLILLVTIVDPEDLDTNDWSGITEEAWNRLHDAISDAGFTLNDIRWQGTDD